MKLPPYARGPRRVSGECMYRDSSDARIRRNCIGRSLRMDGRALYNVCVLFTLRLVSAGLHALFSWCVWLSEIRVFLGGDE